MENNYYSPIQEVNKSKYISKAYLWMFIGLLCTTLTAYYMVASDLVWMAYAFSWLPYTLLIAKIALVIFLSGRIYKMKVMTARIIFVAYSVLTGITFSTLAFIYGMDTVFLAFAFAAILFGCLSIIGFTTKQDFSSMGKIFLVGLLVLFAVGLIGMFVNLAAFDLIIGLVGVILFLGITIYDTQKMKNVLVAAEGNEQELEKISIYFALQLYLDFINIFIYLLRIMGRGRD